MKPVTLKQIAESLSISVATVSKALKDYSDVSEKTKERVKELAKEFSIDPGAYIIGIGDVMMVTVWDHPELTIPTGGQRPAEEDGHRVSSKGTIFYPYVGIVDVAGKTTEQIREILTDRLSKYIRKPQLDVRVVGFNSQKVQVAGAVERPDSYPITDVALMLSDALL